MKVSKKKFLEALKYVKQINAVEFDSLDLSDFPEMANVDKQEIEDFKFTGLLNTDFIKIHLLGEGGYTAISMRKKAEKK